MSKKKLYEYAILRHREVKDGDKTEVNTEIIKVPTAILAADERSALLIIAKQIPDDLHEKIEEVEIAIRPF